MVTRIEESSPLSDEFGQQFAAALTEFAIEAAQGPQSESSRRLRALAHHLPISVWSVDAEGTFTQSYGRALRRVGFDDDALVGLPVTMFGDEAAQHVMATIAGEATSYQVEGVNGDERWVFETHLVPLPEHAGAVAVSIDVTDRQLARDALQAREDAIVESERRFRLIAENAPIGIFIVDADGELTYANQNLEELLQRPMESIVGRHWIDFVLDLDRDAAMEFELAVRDDRAPTYFDYRVVRPDGSTRWARTRVNAMRLADARTAAVGSTADITDVLAAEQQLRESEDRTRAILEAAAEGIVTVDGDGLIVEFNRAAEDMFGYDSDEAIGMPVAQLIADEHRPTLMSYFEERVVGAGEPMSPAAREALALRKDGITVPVELRVSEVKTQSGRLFTGVIHDVSERKAFEQELEHQATHDHLTGLPNRALLAAQLEAALTRANRHHTSVGVLFVELERLKVVTDSLGHRTGDAVILEVVKRLDEVAGPSGTVTRFGGEQFVVFCEELDDVGDAVEIAQRVLDVIDEPVKVGREEAFISAAVGIAFAPLGLSTAEALISNADVAMFRAKESDQRYEIFDAEMRAWVESRRKVEIALRYGIERGEFELHYQPIVELSSGALKGVEALARWNHPSLGLLPPSEFIPVAEDGPLIIALGEELLQQACERLAAWQRSSHDVFISVNLSGRQLALPNLVDVVQRSVHRAGADPSGLHMEITETVLLRNVDAAVRSLEELKAIGVKICLDDFGTGYSSLTYLTRFPIDVLKIDRSFVSHLDLNDRDTSIVTMIVGMAQTLGIDVIAEGVETVEQCRSLTALDCDMAQGFLFARPLPWADVETLLGTSLFDASAG